MPTFDLTKNDPLVGTNFFLEIDGSIVANLASVDGLHVELEKSDINQRLANGILSQRVTFSKPKLTGELTFKRLAPLDKANDAMWKWFEQIKTKGMSTSNVAGERKGGAIVIYDTTLTEIARWTFTNGWPSKIEQDGFDVTKNDPVSETITLQYESLDRTK